MEILSLIILGLYIWFLIWFIREINLIEHDTKNIVDLLVDIKHLLEEKEDGVHDNDDK